MPLFPGSRTRCKSRRTSRNRSLSSGKKLFAFPGFSRSAVFRMSFARSLFINPISQAFLSELLTLRLVLRLLHYIDITSNPRVSLSLIAPWFLPDPVSLASPRLVYVYDMHIEKCMLYFIGVLSRTWRLICGAIRSDIYEWVSGKYFRIIYFMIGDLCS